MDKFFLSFCVCVCVRERKRKRKRKRCYGLTFSRITSLILPKPLQVFILKPGDVRSIILVILVLRPLRHYY